MNDNYELLESIKSSEYKMTFLCREKDTGKKVILKQFHGENEAVCRLKDIRHNNLPQVIEVNYDGSDTTIVEEFIEGTCLSEFKEKLSKDQIIDIILQVLDAAGTLHEKDIIHRDIKAENVIIDSDFNVKLIDFDASRIYKEKAYEDTYNLGTDGYAPPEQYGIGQTDKRADIYAIGVLLNYLLTGEFPSKKLYTGELQTVIKCAINVNKDKRYKDADDFKRAIRRSIALSRCSIIGGILFLVGLIAVLGLGIICSTNSEYADVPTGEITTGDVPNEEITTQKVITEEITTEELITRLTEEATTTSNEIEKIREDIKENSKKNIIITEKEYEKIYSDICKKMKKKWKNIPFVTSREEVLKLNCYYDFFNYSFNPNTDLTGKKNISKISEAFYESIIDYTKAVIGTELKAIGLTYSITEDGLATFVLHYGY